MAPDCPRCRDERENAAYWRRQWALTPRLLLDPGVMVHVEEDLLELIFTVAADEPALRVRFTREAGEAFIRLLPAAHREGDERG